MKYAFITNNPIWSSVRLQLSILLVVAAVVGTMSCGPGGSGPTSPPSGFYVESDFWTGTVFIPDLGARGQYCRSGDSSGIVPLANTLDCTPSNHGGQFGFWGPTGGDGRAFITEVTFPTLYDFLQTASNNCNIQSERSTTVMNQGQVVQIFCQSVPTFSMSPSSVMAGSEPPSVTIWGPGISNAYGPPQVMIYNEFGNVVSATSATSVAPDQSSLTAPTPSFAGLADGTYEVIVGIYDSSGTLQATLGGSIQISGYAPPPPPSCSTLDNSTNKEEILCP
jgi:hypothetical protein